MGATDTEIENPDFNNGGARPLEWVDPVQGWLENDPRLAAIADLRAAHVACRRVNLTPHAIWDPTGRGLPTVFPPRVVRASVGRLDIEKGFLDGHRWILSEDMRFFTSDEAERDGGPNLLTDLDTRIETVGSAFGIMEARSTVDLSGAELAVSAEPSNWGSFLVRALPKIVAARAGSSRILAYLAHPNQRSVVELLGVRPERLVEQQPGVRYRTANCVFRLNNCAELWVSDDMMEVYRETADRAVTLMGGVKINPRIYLSRLGSLGRSAKRSMANEEELARALAGRGFEIIRPEDLSPIEVIAAVANARTVVSAGGAGMFNTVFAGDGTFVVNLESELTWLYGHTNVLQSVLEDRWALFYGNPLDEGDPATHRAWTIDVGALCKELDAILD